MCCCCCSIIVTVVVIIILLAGAFMIITLIFRMLEKRNLSYNDGPIPVPLDEPFLVDNVQKMCVCDTGMHLIHLFSYLTICMVGG